jgi:hypothetical protein
MKKHAYYLAGIILLPLPGHTFTAPYETLNRGFNRTTSSVMVRRVGEPTLANLDCSAYFSNPVRDDPQKIQFKKPAGKISIDRLTFAGLIVSPCSRLSQTPLTEAEKSRPLAWAPLQKRLWEILKADLFGKTTAAVNGEKWADPSVFLPYQEIAALYLHDETGATAFWVKIEFKPWVNFLSAVLDEDHDGFKEMYGKLDVSGVDSALLAKAISWIRSDYCRTVLTKEQTVDWANTLASYWYPKLNTDIVDMAGETRWPGSATEKEVLRELKGFSVDNPTVVIRGNPFGKNIYNVFMVEFPPLPVPAPQLPAVAGNPAASEGKDSSVSDNFRKNTLRFEQETKTNGDYGTWAKTSEGFRTSLASLVSALPQGQLGFKGRDGWLFFGREIDYLNGGDLTAQGKDKNPLPVLMEFRSMLDKYNISLLFCVVPNKSDVYFEKLPGNAPKDPATVINPYGRKFLADLQKNGIEVIDLLPVFLAAKQDDPKNREHVYQKHDTHWSLRGLQAAAKLIAGRIRQYSWYGGLAKSRISYTLKDTVCSRPGDIVERLPENERGGYPADLLAAQQVVAPDGAPYKANNPDAPIMLIGDSFTGVFELVDCKSAGIGAHLAAETGIPVDVITSWGGGPLVRDKMLHARKNYLPKKRLVVYMMVARDLYNYAQNWQPMDNK